MSRLTEDDLVAALHRIVPEPGDLLELPAAVRQRARGMRARRRAAGAAGLVALAVGAGVLGPALLGGAPDSTVVPARGATSPATTTPTPSGTPSWVLSTPTPEAGTVLVTLRARPLRLPALAPGARCPVSAGRTFPRGPRMFSARFTAVGTGPVYLAPGPTVTFEFPPSPGSIGEGSGWSAAKVGWVVRSPYAGPMLIRGRRLDGPQELRFDRYLGEYLYGQGGPRPDPDMAYRDSSDAKQLRVYLGELRLRSPGCYAVQVDGSTATGAPVRETIVFRAEVARR